MTMLNTPSQIEHFRLITLRGAVELEALGMTRRGPSATSIAKKELGLSRNASREAVIEALSTKISGVV